MKQMKTVGLLVLGASVSSWADVTFPIVDTAQVQCYGERNAMAYPTVGQAYYGQDAQYRSQGPSYLSNGNGTVSDQVTGLMWTQDPGAKKTFEQATAGAGSCRVGGYDDWRLPTIKELYSLIQLNGTDPDPMSTDESGLTPFIDASVFNFTYGQQADGDRIIDSQFASSTLYVSTTMGGNKTMFGVNFADGRIKGYPVISRRAAKTFYVLYVRGNTDYGVNRFVDGGDGTVTDEATGLTWMQADAGRGMDWPTALEYAEGMTFAGHSDWRLPDAKELQSIIDYTRSPDTTDSAAIDPIFSCTQITNEGGNADYGHYWTSSTHPGSRGADTAVYFAFGRSLGFMSQRGSDGKTLMDVHGAGSQRSDPKVGDASRFPEGRGPQGDVIRIDNQVRLVRGGTVKTETVGPALPVATRQGKRSGQRGPQQQQGGGMNRPQQQAAGGESRFMQNEDRNNDGKVTRDEFRGPAEHFDRLDKNSDGVITSDEAPTGRR